MLALIDMTHAVFAPWSAHAQNPALFQAQDKFQRRMRRPASVSYFVAAHHDFMRKGRWPPH
jgi:hypothetical protein